MAYKILVIGPAWVGDMVMAQSLFRLLHLQHKDLCLHVLAPEWTFSLLSRMDEVRQAIAMPIGHGQLALTKRYQLARKLARENYDQAIVLPNSFKSALIPFFAGIKKRTGWLGEYRYGLLNDHRKLDQERYPLMVEQYIALGLEKEAPLPINYPYPHFNIKEGSQSATLAKLKPIFRGKPVLAISAGAAFGPSKCWPVEYYAAVANAKLAAGWDVWLFGAAHDKPLTDQIMALTDNRCENIAGRAALAETIDLLSLTSGIVTNDSGLMHIAAALHKPIVAIYGSTSPRFTPPLSNDATILQLSLECQPCFERVCPLKHHRCMLDLLPEQVLNAMAGWQ